MATSNRKTKSESTSKTPAQARIKKVTVSDKPGSSVEAAKRVGGKNDFGVPESDTVERAYASANTKRADPGHAPAHSGDLDGGDGARETGAGADASGPGSSSGGDIDTDIVGVGTGGSGIAASGATGRPSGPDDSDGTAAEFAGKLGKSGAGGSQAQVIPARGAPKREVGQIGGAQRIKGTTNPSGDQSAQSDAGGADNTSNAARGDDSFAAEISSGEARGEDN